LLEGDSDITSDGAADGNMLATFVGANDGPGEGGTEIEGVNEMRTDGDAVGGKDFLSSSSSSSSSSRFDFEDFDDFDFEFDDFDLEDFVPLLLLPLPSPFFLDLLELESESSSYPPSASPSFDFLRLLRLFLFSFSVRDGSDPVPSSPVLSCGVCFFLLCFSFKSNVYFFSLGFLVSR